MNKLTVTLYHFKNDKYVKFESPLFDPASNYARTHFQKLLDEQVNEALKLGYSHYVSGRKKMQPNVQELFVRWTSKGTPVFKPVVKPLPLP